MKNEVTPCILPEVPFSVYLIKDGEVFPKKMFTVTRKSIDLKRLYVYELGREIDHNNTNITVVNHSWPN